MKTEIKIGNKSTSKRTIIAMLAPMWQSIHRDHSNNFGFRLLPPVQNRPKNYRNKSLKRNNTLEMNVGPFVQLRQQKKGMKGSWSAFANSWVNGWENNNFDFLLWFTTRIKNQLVLGTKLSWLCIWSLVIIVSSVLLL